MGGVHGRNVEKCRIACFAFTVFQITLKLTKTRGTSKHVLQIKKVCDLFEKKLKHISFKVVL